MPNFMNELTILFSTWHIARAAGMTAYVLLFLTTAGGLLLSLQTVPPKYRATVTNIHNTLAVTGLMFTLLHLAALLSDKHMDFSLADVVIPFWSSYQTMGTTLGIMACYVMAIMTLTAIPAIMKKLGYKLWRSIHSLAFLGFWIALYHSVVLGTDSGNVVVATSYAFTGIIVVSLSFLRIKKSLQGRSSHYAHSASGR